MTTVAELDCVATVTGTPDQVVEAAAKIYPSPLDPTNDTVTASITYDGALAAAALPGTAHQILAGMRVTIDGAVFPHERILPGATVTLGLGERATFALPMLIRSDWPRPYLYPIGNPDAYLGPPPGAASIDIDGLYLTPSGLKAVRLITGGIVDRCVERFGELDAYDVTGGGPQARHDRRTITYTLPPGSGQQRRVTAGQIAAALGVTDHALVATGRMDKEIQIVDAEGWPLLTDVLLPAGREAHFDRSGTLVDPVRVLKSGRYDAVLDEANLVLAGGDNPSRESSTEGPTKITVRGEAQITKPECGREVKISFVETFRVHQREAAVFRQESNGTLTATGFSYPTVLQLTERVTTVEESECDRPISRIEIDQGFVNPSFWRYEQDTGETFAIKAYNSSAYIVDPGASQGDGALAYLWPVERFVTRGLTITTFAYDDDGFANGSHKLSGGWRQRRAPIKVHDASPLPPPSWEAEDHIEDQKVLGNGEGVADDREAWFGPYLTVARNAATNWQPQIGGGAPPVGAGAPAIVTGVEQETETIEIEVSYDEAGEIVGGFERGRRTETKRWGVRFAAGGAVPYYWYKEGGESPDGSESFAVRGVEAVGYSPGEGDGSHSRITRRYDGSGKPVREPAEAVTIESGLEGYLPSADRYPGIAADASAYPDALPASRRESQPIKCSHTVPVPASIRLPRAVSIDNRSAESRAELCRIAEDELSIAWARRVVAQIPACYILEPGMRVLVVLRRAGVAWPVHVTRVSHVWPEPGEYAVTTIEGRQYVV